MNIYMENKNCLIWNTEDIIKLQKEYRIGTCLIGVIVAPPYDKAGVTTKKSRIIKHRIGRPLLLMKEEIQILKETEKFLENHIEKPTEQEIELINKQQSIAKQKMKDYYINKRNKCRKFYGVKNTDERNDVDLQCTLVPTETAYPCNNIIDMGNMRFLQSEHDQLKCDVYKDLWLKKFYISNASKFGGDFLVYPAEPGKFHSYYIAMCYTERNIELVELANLIRIGVAVKKHVILCYHGDRETEEEDATTSPSIEYITLSWSGIV